MSKKWKPDLSRFTATSLTKHRRLDLEKENTPPGFLGDFLGYSYTNVIDKMAIDDALQVQVYHIATGRTAEFAGFVTDFSDNFSLNWNTTEPFGRADPMMTYKNTVRNINLSWEVPSADYFEGQRNLAEISKLIQFMYATYDHRSFGRTIQGSPLVKIQFTNLVSSARNMYKGDFALNAEDHGLISAISSLTATPDIDAGFMSDRNKEYNPEFEGPESKTYRPGMQYPKKWTIDMSMTILHDHALGNFHQKNSKDKTFPYSQRRSALDFRTDDALAEIGAQEEAAAAAAAQTAPKPTPGQQTVEAIDNALASNVLTSWMASDKAKEEAEILSILDSDSGGFMDEE
jgi:hypothetical protein